MKRYLLPFVLEDLGRKMVFIGGPRQVGKTTLTKALEKKSSYLNWDIPVDRRKILDEEWDGESNLLIFDELHKYKKWRSYLKGLYDARDRHHKRIIVTGSARLDYYRFGGDSLQGRYHYLRLHPLSVSELGIKTQKDLESFFTLSPFPEPCLSGSKRFSDRWSLEYRTRLKDEDLRDLEGVTDLGQIELLVKRLPDLVGSPLSLNALREDLDVSFKSVKKWIEILERFYSIFRLPPLAGGNRLRAVKKSQKHYHFDWNLIKEEGPRFENFVASHLLKWVHLKVDAFGEEKELCFFRDTEDREVDFVIKDRERPTHLVECKFSDTEVSKSLIYLKKKFPNARACQIIFRPKKEFITSDGIEIISALKFLQEF